MEHLGQASAVRELEKERHESAATDSEEGARSDVADNVPRHK